MTLKINRLLMRFTKRAEASTTQALVETFVDAGPLMTLLDTVDHQILYGRRGTGKTHALKYLSEIAKGKGEWSVYVDLRQIGSSGGLYADNTLPISERGTRLLLDVLSSIHGELMTQALELAADTDDWDFTGTFGALDGLADAITQVEVRGTVDIEERASRSDSATKGSSLGLTSKEVKLEITDESASTTDQLFSTKRMGTEHHHVHFGDAGRALKRVVDSLDGRRIWILLDEWSTIPLELQPILADLVRRTVFPVTGVTAKIAAIEHRSLFRTTRADGDYLGIEVGADVSANVDLDDFMVFGHNADQAQIFFRDLLFRHATAANESATESAALAPDAGRFVGTVFTQKNAFDELVRAAEGVPRDAINVVALAAQLAGSDRISVNDVRDAARRWYQRDKEAAITSNSGPEKLLHWIIDRIIGEKRTKGFLLDPDGIHDENVRSLYDSRVLHLIRRGISSRDEPGVRFNAYALDYGCYVHLTAARAPRSLFQAEDDSGEIEVEVPGDDYRSIRTAILDLEKFYSPTVS